MNLGVGLGLRAPHYAHLLSKPVRTQWLEAITENYLGIPDAFGRRAGGRPLWVLEKLRKDFPIGLHGVSLSIGGTDELDFEYLKAVRSLIRRIEPVTVSDHICWTGVGGQNLHDLLPLPFTQEAIDHLAGRIEQVQDFLEKQLVLENVSSYLAFAHSEMPEWQFVSEISRRTGCGLLLDLNNIYVNSVNQGFDPAHYLEAIPVHQVSQFHLAGHSESADSRPEKRLLIDTHDHPIAEPVWDLYRQAVKRFGPRSTLIERDAHIPEYPVIEAEIVRAQGIQKESAA